MNADAKTNDSAGLSQDFTLIETDAVRQFPLEEERLGRLGLKPHHIRRIRDLPIDELAKCELVNPGEFAMLTGRTLKSVQHLLDRALIPVHREGMPGSKRPKRFVVLQEYWKAVKNSRAIITSRERQLIAQCMHGTLQKKRTSCTNLRELR
ncbi:MAG: hypothetical protein RR987_16460 [Hafnia sp.]